MKIRVTSEDIAKGQRCNARFCPVALALQRTTNNPNIVAIGNWGYDTRKLSSQFDLPMKVMRFIDAFDSGNPVEPFEFEMPDIFI